MSNEEWPVLLTVAEVADILRSSKMTVYRLVRSGEIKGKRVGRSYRIPENEVRAYLISSAVVLGGPHGRARRRHASPR